MIEELAEEREPRVERRRQALVRRRVSARTLRYRRPCRHCRPPVLPSYRSRRSAVLRPPGVPNACIDEGSCTATAIGARLVDDQVGDDARIRIGDAAGAGVVGVGNRRSANQPAEAPTVIVSPSRSLRNTWSSSSGKSLSEAPNWVWSWHQVVERSIDRAQAEGQPWVGDRVEDIAVRIAFRDHDLIENELEVGPDEVQAVAGAVDDRLGRRRWPPAERRRLRPAR